MKPNPYLIARISTSATPPKTTCIARAQQRLFKAANKITEPVLVVSTNGGFIRFPWPAYELSGSCLNPAKKDMEAFQCAAEEHLRLLLTSDLLNELSAVASFLTIGMDSYCSYDDKLCELVAIVDLKRLRFKWTGKFYPSGPYQFKNLYRHSDLDSHFIKLARHKVLVLGCHDLNIFSPRGKAVQKEGGWRATIRRKFLNKVARFKPTIVLHHPHTTDSPRIWSTSISALKKVNPRSPVLHFASGINHYNGNGPERGTLDDVLDYTKFGRVLDIKL